MDRELNPPELLAKRQEENRKRMEKEKSPDNPPQDQVRVAFIEQLRVNPTKTLEQGYIDQQIVARDVPLVELVLLSRILEKLH